MQHVESGSINSTPFQVVSYNILAPTYTVPRLIRYPYISAENLSWVHRFPLLLKELKILDGDIVCLQELEQVLYIKQWKEAMEELGYEGVYSAKTDGRPDGVGTFFKSSRYTLYQQVPLQFDPLIDELCRVNGTTAESLSMVTGAVGQITVLVDTQNDGRMIIVGNVHVDSVHTRPDRQLLQISVFVHEAERLAQSLIPDSKEGVPFILCGDFNSQPGSIPYDMLRLGHVPAIRYPEFQRTPLSRQVGMPARALQSFGLSHSTLTLQSAYAQVRGSEPTFTNHTGDFKGTLDYVWFTSDKIGVRSVLNMVDEERIKPYVGCPNISFPSDHLSLKCALYFR